jgi:uncharacterized protein with GYD domain
LRADVGFDLPGGSDLTCLSNPRVIAVVYAVAEQWGNAVVTVSLLTARRGRAKASATRARSPPWFRQATDSSPVSRDQPSARREPMPRYVVLYRFTAEGAKNIRETVKRARQTREQTEKRGFKVQALLWTQGPYDLVSIVDAPSEEAMMGAMANVVAAGNVNSTTMRAFDDKEMETVLKQA